MLFFLSISSPSSSILYPIIPMITHLLQSSTCRPASLGSFGPWAAPSSATQHRVFIIISLESISSSRHLDPLPNVAASHFVWWSDCRGSVCRHASILNGQAVRRRQPGEASVMLQNVVREEKTHQKVSSFFPKKKKKNPTTLASHVSGHKSSRRNNHAGRAGGWKGTTITVPTKFGWLQWLPSQKKQPNRRTVRQEKQLLLHNIWKPENTGMWCNAIKKCCGNVLRT